MNDLIWRQDAIDEVYKASGMGGALKALKSMPSAQQWIPCSERQPEKDGRYWVWCEIFIVPDHVDEPCSYYGSREASYLGGHWYGDSIGEIIAWMPLPEAWKGSEDEEC